MLRVLSAAGLDETVLDGPFGVASAIQFMGYAMENNVGKTVGKID